MNVVDSVTRSPSSKVEAGVCFNSATAVKPGVGNFSGGGAGIWVNGQPYS